MSAASYQCKVLKVIGLAERDQYVGAGRKRQIFAKKQGIQIVPILVDVNFFEDRVFLMGYDAQRTAGKIEEIPGVQPVRYENSVVFGKQSIFQILRPTTAMKAAMKITGSQP